MTLRNPRLFGLDVNRSFADVRDRLIALNNINLPPNDLEIIAGSKEAGAQLADWRSFSRLTEPLHETLDRFDSDSGVFDSLVNLRAGTDGSLFGNLKINGALNGGAIRYRYLEGTGSSAVSKFADISTSRVSAWSSSDPRATNSNEEIQKLAKISYGARLKIDGGKLAFGTQSTAVSGPRLQTSIVPQIKEFDSEFPTHKIQVNVGGSTVSLYTMKGIPVIFKGFFRSLDATIVLTQLVNNVPASWKIVQTQNSNSYSSYPNRGDTTSSISYRSSISRERFIQFYYNPDNIKEVVIRSANISELPAVKFANATSLNFAFNKIRNFPTLTDGSGGGIAENLETLNLRRNPFNLSETESERKLQNSSYDGSSQTTGTVLDKIPTGLKSITFGESFFGSITQNIFAKRFPTLTFFNLGRSAGAFFHPDSASSTNPLPNVSNTVETYTVVNNDFRAFDTSAPGSGGVFNTNQLTNLVTLDLSNNYYLTGTFSIASGNTVIRSIAVSGTGLQFPTGVQGKTSLQTFTGIGSRNLGSLVDFEGGNSKEYVFNNCTNLSSLNLYGSGVVGRFPIFTNASLVTIDMRFTNIQGGSPSGDTSSVIPQNTFQFATNLQSLLIDSGSLITSPIDFQAFTSLSNLRSIWFRSYGRVPGTIPTFQGNPLLTSIFMENNAFTGSPPSLVGNPSIGNINFSFNQLNGTIPTYQNLGNLTQLYLQGNQLVNIGDFINLPNLQYLYLQDNLIGQAGSAEIPDLTDCPSMRFFIAYNNLFKNYKSGSFAGLTQVRLIDLSDNPLTEQAMEQMFEDLYTNWNTAKRGSVTINLRGCGPQSEAALEFVLILRNNGWSITID
tara:strand:- start:7512 stop:10034 length:2523 start_codon:yes stop_codon:yes gene_type:complete